MESEKFWLIFWAIVAFIMLTMTIVSTKYFSAQNDKFIKAGYQETMVVGNKFPIWQKVK